MKILSAEEIKQWDQYTIQHEPVLSIDLMERAATKCTDWLISHFPDAGKFQIFCGKGNNGGDGLAIARMLLQKRYKVTVSILEFGHLGTQDFQTNLTRLHQLPEADIHFIQSEEHFQPIEKGQIVIDALLGSGINRQIEGVTEKLVMHINNSACEIISIDVPSGLFVDHCSLGNLTVHADHTLSIQSYKPAFLVAENSVALGEVHILDIGLHPDYYKSVLNRFELLEENSVRSIHKPRKRFAHKGHYGHALLVAGSYGKMGAAVLSAKACLRSGVGLLTCHIPKSGYDILQSTVPEAMVETDFNSSFVTKYEGDLSRFDIISFGPGIGIASETKMMLHEIFDTYRIPMILDADALNILASQQDLLKLIPSGSILTPHPKEFERLFGETANDFDRIQLAMQKAGEFNCIIILKGHYSLIATPDGHGFFNSTGNPGMATAGSGDVLTGILTGLLAQGYTSVEAAILGVYLHGLAGDLAAKELSMESMVATDIIKKLGQAFLILNQKTN